MKILLSVLGSGITAQGITEALACLQTKTENGHLCQAWNSSSPHKIPENYVPVDAATGHNYCRNPDDDARGAWCYTTTPHVRWEYCDCSAVTTTTGPATTANNNNDATDCPNGTSKTVSGRTCQAWNADGPHTVNYRPGDAATGHNECRNPDFDPSGAWCYTTDPKQRWEYCDCDADTTTTSTMTTTTTTTTSTTTTTTTTSTTTTTAPEIDRTACPNGSTKTVSGRVCQKWNTNTPHNVNHTPTDALAGHNECRNPDADPQGPWCYTTDPNVRWEYCDCSDNETDGATTTTTTTTTDDPPNGYCGRNMADIQIQERHAKLTVFDSKGNIKSSSFTFPSRSRRSAEGLLIHMETEEEKEDGASRIVNGDDAKVGEWPWQVALRGRIVSNGAVYDGVFCGGSLIASNYVVTAAHCTDGFTSAAQLAVTAGHINKSLRLAQGETYFQKVEVEAIIEHPSYSGNTLNSDIAILKLKTAMDMTKGVQPVCLPPSDFSPEMDSPPLSPSTSITAQKTGPICGISGFGNTEGTGNEDFLQITTVPVLKNNQCNNFYSGSVFNHNICTGYVRGGTGPCNGDSGGPLVCNIDNSWNLVGVVSWGQVPCAGTGDPGVFTRVSQFINWIDDVQRRCKITTSRDCKNLALQNNLKL